MVIQRTRQPARTFAKSTRLDTLTGTIFLMRKIVGVIGAVLVVLGFLGSIFAISDAPIPPWWIVLPLFLIPAGFVLLWEAQIAWPRDGSPYRWKRRSAGLLVVLVSFAVIVMVHALLRTSLPNNWLADTLAQGVGVCAGVLLFKQLRQLVSRRFDHDTTSPQKTASG